MDTAAFYKGKKVFITGHTGFKGAWMCRVLRYFGAEVYGYALEPDSPSLFEIADIGGDVHHTTGDIQDGKNLSDCLQRCRPDIVIHMAAQPLVRESYQNPAYTYSVNVMGTVHILEAVRSCDSVVSFINITTDKVYWNNEWEWGYRENDRLDGYEPYSNSKSCSELVTGSYIRSFFHDRDIAVSTCRAGNVIGGGDFAKDRIIPDCVRAAAEARSVHIRNPYSVRPYQHVLEPVFTYLMIARKQYHNKAAAGSYNVGPDDGNCVSTGKLADLFCAAWGEGMSWDNGAEENAPHEAGFLKLDCSKIKAAFHWRPTWDISTSVQKTVEWTRAYLARDDIRACMDSQIRQFISEQAV